MDEQGPWLTVNLAAVVRNARRFAEVVGVPLMPMVKANGYGLGAVAVARALEVVEPWGYGVATLAEAGALRAAGVARPVMAFWPLQPAWNDQYRSVDVRPAIGDLRSLDAWIGEAAAPFHVEIDTGMGRSGFRWHDRETLAAVAGRLAGAPGFEGIFTHFASADGSKDETEIQWARLMEIMAGYGLRPPLIHAANSGAGQWGGRFAGTLARPGIFLYGGRSGLRVGEPTATVTAQVIAVRPVRAGDPVSYEGTYRCSTDADLVTIAIGYADGVHRTLGNRGLVSIGGREYPIAGRVTMDMTMVVAEPGAVALGQLATIIGGRVGLDAQAERAGTIGYELLTSIGPRVVRRYQEVE